MATPRKKRSAVKAGVEKKTAPNASVETAVAVHTLEVALVSWGAAKVSRTIQILGDQTLEDLHEAIFAAFDRFEEHMYEFQFGGKKPMAREAKRYVMAESLASEDDDAAGIVEETTIDSLGLPPKSFFFYWFDFGDSWMHKITVKEITSEPDDGSFPKVIKTIGKSPPQYPDMDDDPDDEADDDEVDDE